MSIPASEKGEAEVTARGLWPVAAKRGIDGWRTAAYAQHMPEDVSALTRYARQARLFRNGRNQAVRIPREFELAAEEVVVYRDDNRLILEPIDRTPSLADVLARLSPLEEEFPVIDDPPVEPEEIF